jgi:hypothetical protein
VLPDEKVLVEELVCTRRQIEARHNALPTWQR